MLSFQPEEEERLAADSARAFAMDKLRPALRQHERGGVPAELRREFHALGLCGVDLPGELGFAGGTLMLRVLVEEAVASGDPGAAFALDGPGAAGWALALLGSEEQQRRLLAPFAENATLRGALAGSTEPSLEARGGKLHGTHRGVLGGASADRVVAFAKDAAYVVERGAFRADADAQPLGLAEVGVADLVFDFAVAEKLAGDAAAAVPALLDRYLLVVAAREVGLSSAAFEHARKYASERQAFGKPVAHFQAVAFMLADMATELDAARLMTWRAARALDTKAADASERVARAAAQAREMAAFVTSSAVQVLGGAGFVQDHPVEKWMRDARAMAVVAREGGLT